MSVGQSATGTKAAAVILRTKDRVWAKYWIGTDSTYWLQSSHVAF